MNSECNLQICLNITGMPLIEKNFPRNKTDSILMIKKLQKATRTLQRICNEVKMTENVAMAKHVPAVKKCLEDLIVRVKAMCVANNCQQVFEVALLKNKNVKGEEIKEVVEDVEEEDELDEQEEEEEDDEGQNETDEEEEDDGIDVSEVV